MIELRVRNWDDKEYDGCGNITVAALECNSITIPLCMECVKDLIDSTREFDKTVFCYQCEYFIFNKWGWKYGGSCCKQAEEKGVVITSENAGYECFVDCMDTCKYARGKHE